MDAHFTNQARDDDDDDRPDGLRCPVCGARLPVYAPLDVPELPPTCPSCGASLREFNGPMAAG